MTTNLSPGVYTRETDFSFYIKQISTSSCGMIGIAERGPINKPTLVTSWEQFVRRFGSYINNGYLAYAARSFFDNGGSVLYVNRVAHYNEPTEKGSLEAVKSSAVLRSSQGKVALVYTGTNGQDLIYWLCKTPGFQGNNYTVSLIAEGSNTPLHVEMDGFNLRVYLATDESSNSISTTINIIDVVDTNSQLPVRAIAMSSGVVTPVSMAHLYTGLDPIDMLKISAITEGVWGDKISVEVTEGAPDPAINFNLSVSYNGVVVEVFKNLSFDENSDSYVEHMINGLSEYITIENLFNVVSGTDRPTTEITALTSGDDGIGGLGDSDFIGDPSQHTGMNAFDEIDALNMLAVPGVTSAPVITAGIAYAESRKDLVFLAEAPVYLEPLEAIDFRKGQGDYVHQAFDSSYAALYYPWIEVSDPITNGKKLIPPTGAVAGCIARSDEKTEVWYAPAGIDRGRIFGVLSLAYNASRGERDALYSEGINVIASFPDSGINIWGQKTLQSQPSSTDRINVRRLMMYVEKAISQSSKFVVFEPNNSRTWRSLVRTITPFLQNIKTKGGFYDFRVQCDEESNTASVIDRNEMVCRIFVKPTKTAEFVQLDFVLTSTGASFREIL